MSVRAARQIAREVRASSRPIEMLGEIYGIVVQRLSEEAMPRDIPQGLSGGAVDLYQRVVYLEPDMDIQHEFHEMMHVLCQIPFFEIDTVAEDGLLMQFERTLAKAVLDDESMKRVLNWQEDTQSEYYAEAHERKWNDGALGSIVRYEKKHFWRSGFRLARKVGLLDKNNFPTFQWPDWSPVRHEDVSWFW